jgi:putative transposase
MTDNTIMASFADLADDQRRLAMARFAVLQPTLENDLPLIRAAAQADVPLRTAQRWLARYHLTGWSALPVPGAATRTTAACPPISRP